MSARFVGGPLEGQHRTVDGADIVYIAEGSTYELRPDHYGACDRVGVLMEGVT
jgi:hypothetical protein